MGAWFRWNWDVRCHAVLPRLPYRSGLAKSRTARQGARQQLALWRCFGRALVFAVHSVSRGTCSVSPMQTSLIHLRRDKDSRYSGSEPSRGWMAPHSWHPLMHVKPGNAVELRGMVKPAAYGPLGSLCARPIAIRWLVAGCSQHDCPAAAFGARPPVCAHRAWVIEPTTWRHDMCALGPVGSRC